MYLIFPADVSTFTDTKFCKHSEFQITTTHYRNKDEMNYDVLEVGVNSKICQVALLVDDKEHHEFIGYSH